MCVINPLLLTLDPPDSPPPQQPTLNSDLTDNPMTCHAADVPGRQPRALQGAGPEARRPRLPLRVQLHLAGKLLVAWGGVEDRDVPGRVGGLDVLGFTVELQGEKGLKPS